MHLSVKKNRLFSLILIILFSLLILLSSCYKEEPILSDTTPTPVLFNATDNNLALNSGNLNYGPLVVSDGKNIYFHSKDDQSLMSSLYDGSEKKVISEKIPGCISIGNNKLFFISGGVTGPIYKVDADGGGETMITDDVARLLIATSTEVFYISTKDNLAYKIAHDGSNKTLIFPEEVSNLLLSDKKLFFITLKTPTKIHCLTKEALSTISSAEDASSTKASCFSTKYEILFADVRPDEVFFTDISQSGIFRMKKEEKPKLFLKKEIKSPFIINSDFLYYIDNNDSNRLYRINTYSDDSPKLVVNDIVCKFAIIGNSVYYSRPTGFTLYRVPVTGGESQKIN